METVTDPKTYENAYAPLKDANRYKYKSDEWAQAVSNDRLYSGDNIDPVKVDEWRKTLSTAEKIEKEDMSTAMDIKAYLESQGRAEEAADFMSRIRPHITNDAQVMQYLGSLKRNSIEGALEQELAKIRKATDKKAFKGGYTDAVNNAARQVEDAIKDGDIDGVKDILKKKLSEFAFGSTAQTRLRNTNLDGEQMVLDLIGGWEPDKKTTAELAAEAGSLIRKINKVADITSKDEAKVLKLLNEASQYEQGTRQFKELQAKAAQILDNKIPVTLGDKVKTTLYDNMLGNFKTALTRNLGGNVAMNSLEKIQKPLKVGIDKLLSLRTGERNYILDPEIAKAYADGFKKGAKEQALDLKTGINTVRSGEESFADALANVRRVYKGSNKISKALGEYDRIVKGVMQMGDRPIYEGEFAAAKTELNKIVKRFGKDALTTVGVPDKALHNIDDTIEFLAKERALESVFQKGTLSAEAFTKMKESLGQLSTDLIGVDAISQFSMPFIQVPANMMSRLSDYLPVAGEVKNAFNTIKELKSGNFNQRRFVDATARNITGLGLFGGGVALANNAAKGGSGITGGYDKDYDKAAAQRNAGEQEYALKFPNGYQVDISDIPVLGPMAQASSRFAEAMRNSESIGEGVTQGAKQALTSAFETSALQGLNRMFGTNSYQSGGIGENVANVLGSGLGQAIPSLIRQGAQVIDPYQRDLGEYNTLPYFLNSAVNATPLRMLALNPKLDNEGNIMEQNQGRNVGMKALENMLLPWKITKPKYSELGEVANDIFENSSDNTAKAYPTVPARSKAKKWLGEDYSNQTYYDVKKRAGELNSEVGNAIINSDYFKNLSADEKAGLLETAYTGINAITREDFEEGYSSDNKFAKMYKSKGVNAAVDYLMKKAVVNDAGLNLSATNKIAQYLDSQGYSFDEINQWYKALGLDPLTADKYKKAVGKEIPSLK